MDKKQLGNRGEDLACALLSIRGYEIVARNYVTRMGEVDIVAFKDGVLVFCEVKTRTAGVFGDGREAVDEIKQQKIRRCAERFILTTGFSYDYIEFHVIEITIEHLKECF